MNKKINLINYTYMNKDRVIVNRVRLYKNHSTVQGQTITGNYVETNFARQFDLQSFC